MSTQERLSTIDEYERLIALPENRERRFELINGVMVEMSPSELHGLIAVVLSSPLHHFVRQHNLGRVGVEVRYQMPGDEHNAVIPDVSFMSKERALPITDKGGVPQMPDLAIEIKSPDDSITGLREKAQYYLRNGARMVWLVFPKQR
ncbi:MAG: hypothetical protein CUN54_09935, partial [Phototrophicales bacterium]